MHAVSTEPGSVWPEPQPLSAVIPTPQALNLNLLPAALQPLVLDVAERMNVPPDMPAIFALCSLAGCVNLRARIQPRASDDKWQVTPCLWGCVVAEPGSKKTPALAEVVAPLRDQEKRWAETFELDLKAHKTLATEYELKEQVYKEQLKAHFRKPEQTPKPELREVAPEPPTCRRLIVQDATLAKLNELFLENPAGLLLLVDELATWLGSFERAGAETDRSTYLSLWAVSGAAPFTQDRVGRGTVAARSCCMSLLGTTQPDTIRRHLGMTTVNDGLLQRLQLLVWPEPPPIAECDRQPNYEAALNFQHACENLLTISHETPLQFRFAPQAQAHFNQWLHALKVRRQNPELNSAFKNHLAKYDSLVPALALLFELVDRKKSSGNYKVSSEHLKQAIDFTTYLESHAEKLYSFLSKSSGSVHELVKHLHNRGGKLRRTIENKDGVFTLRDVYRYEWAGLKTQDQAKAACDLLVELGWLVPTSGLDFGDPLFSKILKTPAGANLKVKETTYLVNPKALEVKA